MPAAAASSSRPTFRSNRSPRYLTPDEALYRREGWRRPRRATSCGAFDYCSQPFVELLVTLKPCGRRLERTMQSQEVAHKSGVGQHGLGKSHVG